MEGGGGAGAIHQSMRQAETAKRNEDKGGVMDLVDSGVVKFKGTNVLVTQTGNLDSAGQQASTGFGIQNAATMSLDQHKNALGLPDAIGEMNELQSELSERFQGIANVLKLEGTSPPEDASHVHEQSPGPTPWVHTPVQAQDSPSLK